MRPGSPINKITGKFSIRHLSLRRRISIFISLLLLVLILVFGAISYMGIRQATFIAGEERLQSLSQQLGSMLSESTRSLVSSSYQLANITAIQKVVDTRGKDSLDVVRSRFEKLIQDSAVMMIDLRAADGERLLHIHKGEQRIFSSPLVLNSLMDIPADSGVVGKLYLLNGRLHFPVIAHIREEEELKGYLIIWRRLTARGVDQINKLMGPDAIFFLGNTDGSLWTDLARSVPLSNVYQKDGLLRLQQGDKRFMAAVQGITNSQWQVMVEFPMQRVLEASDDFMYWLVISGIAILLVGVGLTWLISGNLSRPIKQLTKATTDIAYGNYAAKVPTHRYDEIGKLARSFQAMAKQLKNSHAALAEKAENYRMLFQKNPLPMWIMSTDGFQFLDVNESALNHYGYTREEFLQLDSRDIHHSDDILKFRDALLGGENGRKSHGIWRHKKKGGTIIMVDLITDDILYNNQASVLILAQDITEKLQAEAELVRHRIMQQEIITETTILVQEKEREEIGKELHDNINQILTATKLYLELAMTGDKDHSQDAIAKSYDNVNLVMKEIRQLSKQLVRPAFDTSLTDALKDLTEEIKAITPLKVHLKADELNESLVDETIRLMIYRVVQEQLNNILKHAAASTVHIDIKTEGKQLRLVIRDNGIGFDMSTRSKGIGLRNIDNRVRFHKGIVSIHSRPGEGCVVEIIVPTQRKPVAV